jgi:hypothetical protein
MLISKGPAFAERFSVDSECCGRLYYSIDPDGGVHGHDPKQEGRLSGTISGDGTAKGILDSAAERSSLRARTPRKLRVGSIRHQKHGDTGY